MPLTMLNQRSQFLALKSGVSFVTRSFVLQAGQQKIGTTRPRDKTCEGAPEESARFGITVSKYTVKGKIPTSQKSKVKQPRGAVSVMRNRIKRRLREALREVAPGLALPNTDYVVIGRASALTIPFVNLTKDLEKSFQNVNRKLIPSEAHGDKKQRPVK